MFAGAIADAWRDLQRASVAAERNKAECAQQWLAVIAAVCGEFGFFCLELFYTDIIPIVATKAIDYSFIYLVSYWIRKIA